MTEEIKDETYFRLKEEYLSELQRLKQENKALKDNNNHLQVIIDDGRAENKRFQEENKKLKDVANTSIIEQEKLVAETNKLRQENKELKATIYKLESKADAMCDCNKGMNEDLKLFRSALEDIRTYLYTLSSIDSDFTNTETYLRIQDKIDEVL